MSQRLAIIFAVITTLTALFLPQHAFAQGRGDGSKDEDRAAAQVLFDEAQVLAGEEKWAEACKKFEGSQKLDPSVGTQLNLANCYEKLGKIASAWINFHEVAQVSGDRRSEFAQQQADRLEPNLVMLHLELKRRVDGMTVTRGDEQMEEPTWDEPVPVDPGTYDIVVKAPGHSPWRKTVKLQGEGETIKVVVPALIASAEPDPETPPPSQPADEGTSGQLIAGAVIAGLGGAAVVAGVALAVVAHGKNDDSLEHCPTSPTECYAPGVELREEAQGLQAGYMGAFIAGGAALVAGIVLIAIAPSGDDTEGDAATAELSVYPGGLRLTGTF